MDHATEDNAPRKRRSLHRAWCCCCGHRARSELWRRPRTREDDFLLACSNGQLKVVEDMVKGGADSVDPTCTTLSGYGGLHAAAAKGHRLIVEYLLDCDVEVDMSTNSGMTALMFAAIGGFDDVVEVLLQRGAQIMSTCRSPHGDKRTADDLAHGFGNHELSDKLSEAMKASAARQENEGPTVGQLQRMNANMSEVRPALRKRQNSMGVGKTGNTSDSSSSSEG